MVTVQLFLPLAAALTIHARHPPMSSPFAHSRKQAQGQIAPFAELGFIAVNEAHHVMCYDGVVGGGAVVTGQLESVHHVRIHLLSLSLISCLGMVSI
jgi:hypothetical protein